MALSNDVPPQHTSIEHRQSRCPPRGALETVRCPIGITQQRTLGVLLLPAGFGGR